MRFLAILILRTLAAAALISLQVIAVVFLFLRLDEFNLIVALICAAIFCSGIVVVIAIINKRINPNHAVAWITLILIFPAAGLLLFFVFFPIRVRRALGKSKQEREKFLRLLDVRECTDLQKTDAKYFAQSQYLLNTSQLPVYICDDCRYYGEYTDFFLSMLSDIRAAKKFIFLEYFLIKRGKMWDAILSALLAAAKSGVEVRILADNYGAPFALPLGYAKRLSKCGIQFVKFDKYLPLVRFMGERRNHRKITIIDGEIAFVGGGNLSDEYINQSIKQIDGSNKQARFKDCGVRLAGKAVKSLTAMFLLDFYGQKKRMNDDFLHYMRQDNDTKNVGHAVDAATNADEYNGFLQPFGSGPVPLYSDKVAQNAIINMVNGATEYVYITTPYLIIDFYLTETLKTAVKRGVEIRIFTPKIPDRWSVHLMTRASYGSLIAAGVQIFEYTPGFLHAKNVLCDDKAAIVSSINLDYRSMVHHLECGVWMYGTPAIADIKRDFDHILSVSERITPAAARLSLGERILKCIIQPFTPLM